MKNHACVCLSLLCLALSASAATVDPLEQSFVTPPPSARPWVLWFPLSGNLTKAGLTADLESMARVGIGGALYMETGQGTPAGPADFAGPLWMEMNRHICSEAKRLGLELSFNNDAGWTGSGGPWITPEMSMQTVVWSEVAVQAGSQAPIVLPQPKMVEKYYQDIAVLAMPAPAVDSRIPDFETKSSLEGSHRAKVDSAAPADFKEAPAGSVIARDQLLDLTGKMDGTGKLQWTPPAGKWVVIRFGHTSKGLKNRPAPATGTGLECDKLSKAAATLHFENLMQKIVQQNKALAGQGKTLVGVHIDSWELGGQNWTPLMREEFKKRRGYDMLPFLPAFTGRIVGSTETTERFLWDLRQTISDLLVENYAGTIRKLANQNGLRLTIEAYGGPEDNMAYAGQCDEPTGEFWAYTPFKHDWSCLDMSSAGHTYGKQIVAAEAFTSTGNEKWLGHPGNVKYLGDWAFCEGINRFVFHRFAAQPWTNVAPGMSMGPWGMHYERTQTWWEQSKAWHEYVARCQSLLQQGKYAADIAYLAPEGAPRQAVVPAEAELAPHIRSGYGFDACSPEVVLTRMSVKDGRIVLPDGMSYRTLVLPASETITPPLLAKIKQLADAGAMIVGPAKPPRKSPSLADMGAGDEVIKKNAADLWASGKILTGKSAQDFLAERGVPADFTASPVLRYIHRTIGDAEVYFVANPEPAAVEAVASFRVAGRQPEIWWPESGCMESSVAFLESNGVTRVPLHLEPAGSAFVVFRKPSAGIDPVVALRHNGSEVWSLSNFALAHATAPAPAPKPAATTATASPFRITKAIYGLAGDPKLTRDVTQKVQALVDAGATSIVVRLMFKDGDPAPKKLKTLGVEYVAGGQTLNVKGTDKETITLTVPAVAENAKPVVTETPKPVVPQSSVPAAAEMSSVAEIQGGALLAHQAGRYELKTGSGKTRAIEVPALPTAQDIAGPWKVNFAPKSGGPGEVKFDKLADWSKRPENGIKYYSGTAVYENTFAAPPVSANTKWMLDLGAVEVVAEVKLNGKDLGILWKAPYQVDVTSALKPGENKLELKIVNLWVNRQIGDEQLPEDSPRDKNGTMKTWPDWLQQGKPSPTGRISFTSWRLWKKGDPLVPSGLIGPVTLQPSETVPIN